MVGLPEETTPVEPTPAENQRRISTALKKLLAKCTEEGATPTDDRVGSLLDCIAEHFKAGSDDFIIALIIHDDGTYSFNKTPAQIVDAAYSFKHMYVNVSGFYLPLQLSWLDDNKNYCDLVFESLGFHVKLGANIITDKITVYEVEEIGFARLYEGIRSGAFQLKSSTSGSSKVFAITVDDNGALTATEVS